MSLAINTTWLVTLLLVSTRILTWLMIAPPMATAGVPRTVKGVLSVGLALAIVPTQIGHTPAPEFVPVAGSLLEQILIGGGLGFLTRLIFTAIESAGALLDLFGGFSLASAYQPLSSSVTSIFGGFYGLLSTTLIFVTNAHLLIFQGMLRTFHAVPVNGHIAISKLDQQAAGAVTQLFLGALQIAGPILIVLFIADIALGVLNRIAPQLNAFAMSFPVKIGLTLLLVGGGLALMPQTVVHLAGQADEVISAVTG
jgi:flagellar biosynthetic protein FliR